MGYVNPDELPSDRTDKRLDQLAIGLMLKGVVSMVVFTRRSAVASASKKTSINDDCRSD
jgi:hypothetical protein